MSITIVTSGTGRLEPTKVEGPYYVLRDPVYNSHEFSYQRPSDRTESASTEKSLRNTESSCCGGGLDGREFRCLIQRLMFEDIPLNNTFF